MMAERAGLLTTQAGCKTPAKRKMQAGSMYSRLRLCQGSVLPTGLPNMGRRGCSTAGLWFLVCN